MASPFDAKHNAIRAKIADYANRYGLPVNIGIWQIWQESRFNPRACSGAGACGIAQFMPATAARFGVNRNDVDSSLDGWGKYMSWLLRQPYINGNIKLALAGYNAGEGAVKKYKGIPPYRETQNYVKTIMANANASGYIEPTGSIGASVPIDYVYDAGDIATVTVYGNESVSGGNLWGFALLGIASILFVSYVTD